MLTFVHPQAVNKFRAVNRINDTSLTLPVLQKLGRAFQNIPYENLTKLIRSCTVSDIEARIRLPELLYEEHLQYGTGGTCFSMTYFMQTILRSFGFNTYPIMADRPLAPDTHCASIIIIDGSKYLLDPGFMIDSPLPLTKEPTSSKLRHNTLIIGALGSVDIPAHQMLRFQDLKNRIFSPLPFEDTAGISSKYIIATHMHGRQDIRYILKDVPVDGSGFLKHWQNSFDWPTLRNISITTATDNGYIYARNNFIRTSTFDGKKQERISKNIDLSLCKTFNIDRKIIKEAFEVLSHVKGKCAG